MPMPAAARIRAGRSRNGSGFNYRPKPGHDHSIRCNLRRKDTIAKISPQGPKRYALFSNHLSVFIIFAPVEDPTSSINASLCQSALARTNAIAPVNYSMPQLSSLCKLLT